MEYKKLYDVSARVMKQVEIYSTLLLVVLYKSIDKYIAPMATNLLNLSAQVLQQVRPVVENGYGQIDLFDPLYAQIKYDLSTTVFVRFNKQSST